MRLLLDENLSPRIIEAIRDLFPAVVHVRDVGLQSADDQSIWTYAGQHDLLIVTKDLDFNHRAFLVGPPPKVVWINRGNCSTGDVVTLLRAHQPDIVAFETDADSALLILG